MLGNNRYGKQDIRLATVRRESGRHRYTDVTVDVSLEGEFGAAYRDGDNANILPTDTMRGTVYAFAKQAPVGSVEAFGLRLARHFVDTVAPVTAAVVSLRERQWARIDGHDHVFARTPGVRTAVVRATADGADVVAGVEDCAVVKTTNSRFAGFLHDRYTTLAPTDDRILATTITASWRYARLDVDWDTSADAVRRTILATFAAHDSRSLQHTLHAMGGAVLAAHDAVAEVRFSLPNQHHVEVDLSPYGLDNVGEVFVVTERPYGLVEGTIVRG